MSGSSYQYIYVMKDMSKSYNGNKEVLKNVWLSFLPGAKIGIIGANGSGKSTILKIMAGIDKDYTGEAWASEGARIGYLSQEPQLDSSKTVYENILAGVGRKREILEEYNAISTKFADPDITDDEMMKLIERQGELQEEIDACDAWGLEREIEIMMNDLKCPPKDASVTNLSGGEKRRIALCRLLIEKSDMLLLDEPTNHLDAESIARLEKYLKEYKGTVVLITHDRYFLDNVTEWILEIDRGQTIPWKGSYSSWLDQKSERLASEERDENNRQAQLKRELEWINQSAKARQAKGKARISAYEKLANQETRTQASTAQIIIPDGPRLGDVVVIAEGLTKSFGDKKLLNDFGFIMPPGAVVGVVGPNGAGKSTLIKMITGVEKPDSGTIKLGDTVQLGYVDQSRDTLNDNKSVWEEISDGLDEVMLGKIMVKSRAYCASFNFRGGDQQKKVGQLSGGERNRVHLAKMLKTGANLILLDEPTNDLDVDTLRALEEAIENFSGCAIVISHDRWFLDRIATHIISFENDKTVWFEGNYSDYEGYLHGAKQEAV